MITKKMCLAATAAVCLLMSGGAVMAEEAAAPAAAAPAAAGPAAGAPNLAQTVALLPRAANVTVALNVAGFDNPRSLLSYVPRADLEKLILEDLEKEGGKFPAPNAAAELAGHFLFNSGLGGGFSALAVGMYVDPTTGAPPQEAVVLTGSFKAAELGPKLAASHGVTAGANGGTATVTGAEGNTFHLAMPRDGVLLISENQSWVASGGQGGLTENDGFRRSWASLGTNVPDAFVWADVALLRQAASENPMIAMFAGPVLSSNGVLLTLDPGDVPTASLLLSFNDAQGSQMGVMFFQQLIEMGKAQLAGMAGDPQMAEQLGPAMKALNELRTSSDDRSARLIMRLTELPSREEVRQSMLENAREAMSGNLPVGLPF